MIKKILLATAAICGLCSCNEKVSVQNSMEGQVATIDFSVPIKQTKALAPAMEDAVNSLQIFVFGTDGRIDAFKMANGASLQLVCTTGEKEIFALVNAPEIRDVYTKQDLMAKRTGLEENVATGLVMEGYLKTTLSSSSSVSVPVYRNAARVSLKSVKTAFELDVHKAQEFKITGVMLTNVAGDKVFTGNTSVETYTDAPLKWYNKQGVSVSPLAMLSDNVSAVVNPLTPYEKQHYFYCYPNPTSLDVVGGEWSPRYTRLVVAATLGGVSYYYPISIPDIKSNTCYDVSLTVTRPGSSSIDVPVKKLDATINVEVKPWIVAPAVNEVI